MTEGEGRGLPDSEILNTPKCDRSAVDFFWPDSLVRENHSLHNEFVAITKLLFEPPKRFHCQPICLLLVSPPNLGILLLS